MAGGQEVATIVRRDDFDHETLYHHFDQLGSVETITDESGAVVEELSLDAFGKRRDATDWLSDLSSGVPENINKVYDRGYTGHEQLDNLGLVHMNGRVYDPDIGRFLSADPFVPNPFGSQSFNRYSYIENNPLNAIDPTGFFHRGANDDDHDDDSFFHACILSLCFYSFGSNNDLGLSRHVLIEFGSVDQMIATYKACKASGDCGGFFGGKRNPPAKGGGPRIKIRTGANLSGDGSASVIINASAQGPDYVESNEPSQGADRTETSFSWLYWLSYGAEAAGWALIAVDVVNTVILPTPDVGIAGAAIIGSARAARAIAPSSRALGRALEALGILRPAGSAAHHVVAGAAPGAATARATLERFGVGINDAINGVFLPSAQHATLHTKQYFEAVNSALSSAKTRAEVEQTLQFIARGIQAGTFP